jgi:small-conductance mechanosensitive channel
LRLRLVATSLGGFQERHLNRQPPYHGLIAWAVSTLIVVYLLSSAASGLIGGAVSTASSALGGAGKALGGSVQTAVHTGAAFFEQYERSNGYDRE